MLLDVIAAAFVPIGQESNSTGDQVESLDLVISSLRETRDRLIAQMLLAGGFTDQDGKQKSIAHALSDHGVRIAWPRKRKPQRPSPRARARIPGPWSRSD